MGMLIRVRKDQFGPLLDPPQKSWMINEAIRAQVVMEYREIDVQRAQGLTK
jgi:hypothetical protein